MPNPSPRSEKLKELLEQAQKRSDDALNKRKKKRAADPAAEQTAEENTEAAPQAQERDFDMENNTFYKIVFKSDAAPEEKKRLFAEAMTHSDTMTHEENKERQREFKLFKEYLQHERRRMAQDMIAVSDTEALAQLHEMINDMCGAIDSYDKNMQPLTDIIDALWTLRQEGKEMTLGLWKEIKDTEKAKKARDKEVAEREADIAKLKEQDVAARGKIEALRQQKSGFPGFRKTSPEALVEIAKIEESIAQRANTIKGKTDDLEALKASPLQETKFPGFEKEKEQLKILLEISSEQWRDKQHDLIDSANKFIDTAANRGAAMQQLLESVGEQIDTLTEANRGIQSIYSLMAEASVDAARANKAQRDKMMAPVEGETRVQETMRKNKLANLEDYISTAEASARDTAKGYSDIAVQGNRITSLKGANIELHQIVSDLTNSGIAGVAEGLSVALTTLTSAAINESAEHARDSLRIMSEKTDMQNQKEALRQAAGYADLAEAVEEQAEKLRSFEEVSKVSTDLKRKGLAALTEAIKKSKACADDLQEATSEQRGVNSEASISEGLASEFNKDAANNNDKPADAANNNDKSASPAAEKPAPQTKKQPPKDDGLSKLGRGS